ncbi:toxic anion resistance protein [Lysinibacillus piscis]|uniref:Toxic anion resistance protein n=1 Tax=Lysinibacillus piscis TaxID=2518931 RepID=A0ABQ5NPI5_9BACI|nr:toxic anion resistance protein [Lysinibacillus sp. KH24]GLC90281.1 hypothetical protein LYSBPC_34080 [Lysinibacillus sp. KH24]
MRLEQLTPELAVTVKQQLRQSAEVQQIANHLNIKNQMDVMALGKEPAIKLAQFSDRMLQMLATSKANDSSALLKQLEDLLVKFDRQESTEEKGFFKKFFKRPAKKEEDILASYPIISRDIEKIHYQFVVMEDTLAQDNRMLAQLYNEDIQYYLELEKYSVAAEMKLEEIQTTLMPMYEKQSMSGNQMAQMELTTLQNSAELLAQKIDELEKSRMVAILAAPQIEMLRQGNHQLIEQINNAFVKTIPVFKLGMMNAIQNKKQQLQQNSAAAFEKRMHQFGGANADAVQLSMMMAQQTDSTLSLEDIWETLMIGIADYRQLRDEQTTKQQQIEQQLMTLQP